MKILKATLYTLAICAGACSSAQQNTDTNAETDTNTVTRQDSEISTPKQAEAFVADSAYAFVDKQVAFGPRVPGTQPHDNCAAWLISKLRAYGAQVTEQNLSLTAFDGTQLPATNILGQYNPQASDRTLLVAHWDTRPWADADPNPANHNTPVPGANDGASGVGVLLEIARVINTQGTDKGIDILFVDAEDYGTDGDDMSWAMGARAFVQTPPIADYRPARVILLDMVGGKGSTFRRETFSDYNATSLLNDVWRSAAIAGHSDLFVNIPGGAITDDHVEFLRAGIPAIDIIALTDNGFLSTWHTPADNMDNIDPAILNAVGRTVLTYLYK